MSATPARVVVTGLGTQAVDHSGDVVRHLVLAHLGLGLDPGDLQFEADRGPQLALEHLEQLEGLDQVEADQHVAEAAAGGLVAIQALNQADIHAELSGIVSVTLGFGLISATPVTNP